MQVCRPIQLLLLVALLVDFQGGRIKALLDSNCMYNLSIAIASHQLVNHVLVLGFVLKLSAFGLCFKFSVQFVVERHIEILEGGGALDAGKEPTQNDHRHLEEAEATLEASQQAEFSEGRSMVSLEATELMEGASGSDEWKPRTDECQLYYVTCRSQ